MKYRSVVVVILITFSSKFSFAQIFGPQYAIGGDTCIFDIHCENIIIDTSQSNNLWQIGKPSKIFIDTAFMGTRAIIIDSLTVYDTNNISSFTLQLIHPGTRMHELIFWHMYETDEGKDGGYIEMSYDMGATWTDLNNYWNYPLAYQLLHLENYYSSDDSINGRYIGFNGSTDTWLKSTISWDAITYGGHIDERVNQDTTLLRFTFISDSILDTLDGWCIDNIIHLLYETPNVLESKQKEHSIILYPNPGYDIINVENDVPLLAIEIYSVMGNMVVRIDNPSRNISIESLPQGLYSVVFYSNNQIRTVEKLLIIN